MPREEGLPFPSPEPEEDFDEDLFLEEMVFLLRNKLGMEGAIEKFENESWRFRNNAFAAVSFCLQICPDEFRRLVDNWGFKKNRG